jgi:hypothetical protein
MTDPAQRPGEAAAETFDVIVQPITTKEAA